ncbi:Vegetative incompatibility protein [Drechslerella dactyloides]|uniref:Vegetative incompatibility protein n=1 Tax=Drechslerella dactyloides TaxID=74499 RepID=A0AAD6IT82_DREDA|nr:Vegetative incompatibility protein [Drechslerella dactyloides]
MFQLTTGNFAVEAPIEELQIASRATNADEWKLYLRWELAYLFTRVRSFDDDLLGEVLKYSTPHSGSGPPEAAAAAARSYARDCLRQLTALLAESHREFASIIVDRTELGRVYKDRATQAKTNRSERPRLDTSELSRSLVFSPEDVKALWYPLHFAISGRYFDEDRLSDRYSDVRTVLSQTSSWIIREFINLILLGPTSRSASDLAGLDIISRSAESVSAELTRWPEISSSLQKRLDGWQRTLIAGNSYPTKDSPQCGHIWENLVAKATVMGQLQVTTPIIGGAPFPLRPMKQTSSYEQQQPQQSTAATGNYVPDRSASYNQGSNPGSSNGKQPQISHSGSLRSPNVNAYTSNTSRRIEPAPLTTNAGGTSNSTPAAMETNNSTPVGSTNFDEYVRNQFDLQDKTIADAVSYFNRERQRMGEVKEKLRDLETQQEVLTANYRRQMEDLDRRKREVFDRYRAETAAPPPVSVPAHQEGIAQVILPQQSAVHFDLGEAERHVGAAMQQGQQGQGQHHHHHGPGGVDYYEDEWDQSNAQQQAPRRHNSKLQKMHPELAAEASGGPSAQPTPPSGADTPEGSKPEGKGKQSRITISQPPDTIDSSADPPSPTTTQAPYIATGATPPLPTSTTNTSAATTATVVTATTTIATIATVTTANNGLVKPKEPKSQGPDLWAEAFEKLSDDEKIFLGQIDSTKVTWQDHIQLLIEETKGLREASRAKAWKITWGNQEIILRDIAEKAVKWIQKFVTVGDIAVQYDPVHSALPWAAVRFVLQSAISDFETKATILIGIEKVICTIGRFTAYEKMYIGFGFEYEETLKKRLVAFYMSILRFLTKSKRFFETSTIGRAARAILPDKFSEYLSDLQTDEIEALKDVEVVKAQRVHDKDISHLGKLEALKLLIDGFTGPISRIDTIVESISDNLSKQERGEALQWASSINHHHQHEFVVDTITPGTCTWLHDNAKFLEWRKSSSSSIFWLKGDAGSGKTRLTDGKGEDQSRTTAESISGSLLKQMATLHPGSPLQLPIAEEYRKRVNAGNHKTSPTFTEVCKMINDIAVGQLYPSITIIIDAMDECQNEARWDLTTWLADLVQVSNCLLKIFVSSRPHEVDLNIQLENVPKHYIELQDTSEDVKIFIATKMQDYLNKKRFLPREPWSEREKAKMKVVTELQTKCRGMFLWADLQMKELCRLTSASEVDACLLKLPKTLEATYKHIIAQIKEAGDLATKAAITAFLWLLGTLTPLKPTELLGAVREKTSANLNLDSLLEICRNLLVLDRKEYVIRFLHLSVVEFLRQADEHFLGVSFQPQETINSVAMDCLDFLGATDGRATFFDPVYLSIFCLRGYDMPDIRDFPHEKYPHLDKLDYIMQYETNDRFMRYFVTWEMTNLMVMGVDLKEGILGVGSCFIKTAIPS